MSISVVERCRVVSRRLAALCCASALALGTVAAAADSSPGGSSDKQGFLYEVVASPEADGGRAPSPARLVLFGTIHVDRADGVVLNARSRGELEGAQRLALEANPRDVAALVRTVRRVAYYPAGDGLSRHLPSNDLAALRRIASRYDLTSESLELSKPWFIANYLATLELRRAGLDPERGSEGTLAQVAVEHAIPVVEIEGFEQQLAIFDHEPAPLQQSQLEESINDITSGRLVDEANSLIDAWHASDDATLNAELETLRQADTPFTHFTLENLIIARDRTMADRAEDYLRAGGTTFFAVGCLHLFGESGLVLELRRRGYRVRDLQ